MDDDIDVADLKVVEILKAFTYNIRFRPMGVGSSPEPPDIELVIWRAEDGINFNQGQRPLVVPYVPNPGAPTEERVLRLRPKTQLIYPSMPLPWDVLVIRPKGGPGRGMFMVENLSAHTLHVRWCEPWDGLSFHDDVVKINSEHHLTTKMSAGVFWWHWSDPDAPPFDAHYEYWLSD